MIEAWRLIATAVILSLGIADLIMTFRYIRKYKRWQPNKPYKLMEKNPLLVFLWKKLGIEKGTIAGGLIILFLIYIIGLNTHWSIIALLFTFQVGAILGHRKNMKLLNKLINKYPSGHLPEKTFGKVEGNN